MLKPIQLPLLIVLLFLAACSPDPKDEPKPATANDEPPPCDCQKLILGYFEMEDCQVYLSTLPGQPPFSCTGGKLEVSTNFQQHRVTFRSDPWTFCEHPFKLWVWGNQIPSPLSGLACEVYVLDATLDFGGRELDLQLDEEFLICAYEEEDGFWFSLSVE